MSPVNHLLAAFAFQDGCRTVGAFQLTVIDCYSKNAELGTHIHTALFQTNRNTYEPFCAAKCCHLSMNVLKIHVIPKMLTGGSEVNYGVGPIATLAVQKHGQLFLLLLFFDRFRFLCGSLGGSTPFKKALI